MIVDIVLVGLSWLGSPDLPRVAMWVGSKCLENVHYSQSCHSAVMIDLEGCHFCWHFLMLDVVEDLHGVWWVVFRVDGGHGGLGGLGGRWAYSEVNVIEELEGQGRRPKQIG